MPNPKGKYRADGRGKSEDTSGKQGKQQKQKKVKQQKSPDPPPRHKKWWP